MTPQPNKAADQWSVWSFRLDLMLHRLQKKTANCILLYVSLNLIWGCCFFFHQLRYGTQKFKIHQLRTQSSKVLPLKPGVDPHIAMHTMPTARDFFLANLYASGPFTCIFSKPLPEFFLCSLWLTPVPVWARRIKYVTLLIVTDS